MSSPDHSRRVELSASGSTVDVASIPCHFQAAKYDVLDRLFLPLLTLAQQANDLMGLRVGDDKSALRAASYLAGELLRDTNFAPVRSLVNSAHAYVVDLPGNSLQVQTNVFTTGAGKSSLFRLKVKGAIRGDKFVVMDPETNNTLFSFTRFEADKPDFFTRDFPFLAQESRKDPTMFGGGQAASAQGVIDLMLGVPINGKTLMVRVQKQNDAATVEVKHITNNKTLMTLPLASLSNIAKLVETVGRHLSANAASLDLHS